MRRRRSIPSLAYWAAGIVMIVAAVLVAPSSTVAALALVAGGFGLAGLYWMREHPGRRGDWLDWDYRDALQRGEGGEGGGGGGGGGGDGGGG
jgi:hypothetical protein